MRGAAGGRQSCTIFYSSSERKLETSCMWSEFKTYMFGSFIWYKFKQNYYFAAFFLKNAFNQADQHFWTWGARPQIQEKPGHPLTKPLNQITFSIFPNTCECGHTVHLCKINTRTKGKTLTIRVFSKIQHRSVLGQNIKPQSRYQFHPGGKPLPSPSTPLHLFQLFKNSMT